MNIVLTIPSLTVPHGGTRVIMEWANYLSHNHNVFLYCKKSCKCNWFKISPRVTLISEEVDIRRGDCLIVCSPHDVDLIKSKWAPKKQYFFLQMLEHLFSENQDWKKKCEKVYSSNIPIFLISKWNREFIRNRSPRTRKIYYIGNGVNLSDFPIEDLSHKNDKIILVEGWNALNPTKDINQIAPKVALRLKKMGFRVLAYSQKPPIDYKHVPDEFYVKPSLSRMNDLYRRATLLLKATICDARSCSPMEAMTKGTVTVRAIVRGDDDLIHNKNCLRVGYDENELYGAVLSLYKNFPLKNRLSKSCLNYVKTYTWDYWMTEVEGILS